MTTVKELVDILTWPLRLVVDSVKTALQLVFVLAALFISPFYLYFTGQPIPPLLWVAEALGFCFVANCVMWRWTLPIMFLALFGLMGGPDTALLMLAFLIAISAFLIAVKYAGRSHTIGVAGLVFCVLTVILSWSGYLRLPSNSSIIVATNYNASASGIFIAPVLMVFINIFVAGTVRSKARKLMANANALEREARRLVKEGSRILLASDHESPTYHSERETSELNEIQMKVVIDEALKNAEAAIELGRKPPDWFQEWEAIRYADRRIYPEKEPSATDRSRLSISDR